MIFFPDAETFFKAGDFAIGWNVILLILGIYITAMISRELLKKEGTSYALSEDLFVGTLFFGFLSTRVIYCLQNSEFYFSDYFQILNIGDGGFNEIAGFAGGLIFAVLFCKANHLSLLRIADAVLPNALLGGAVFSIHFERAKTAEESFFAYLKSGISMEGIVLILGFILISVLFRVSKKRRRGSLAYASLIWLSAVSLLDNKPGLTELLLELVLIGIGAAGLFGLIEKSMKKQKPVLLFDLDGTLLDTQPAIFYGFTKLFEHYAPDTQVTAEILNSILGPPIEDSVKKYFPKENTEALVKEYRRHNIAAHETLVHPMEGCAELLQSCKEAGYRMAVISAKRKDIVELGCRQCGILDYFEVILGGDEVKKHKPDPEGLFKACQKMKVSKDNAVYVGDSPTDIQAAKNAGMYSIGYIFNQERKQALLDSKPNACVDDLLRIREILKEDHAWTNDLM